MANTSFSRYPVYRDKRRTFGSSRHWHYSTVLTHVNFIRRIDTNLINGYYRRARSLAVNDTTAADILLDEVSFFPRLSAVARKGKAGADYQLPARKFSVSRLFVLYLN